MRYVLALIGTLLVSCGGSGTHRADTLDLGHAEDLGATVDLASVPDLTQPGAPCNDGVIDGNETDVDCGGGRCVPCALGLHCTSGARDCESGICSAATHVCVADSQPLCSDQIQDGSETDVDCGGGTCPLCAFGKKCNVGTDCVTGNCYVNFEYEGTCVSCGPCNTPPGPSCLPASCGAQHTCFSDVLATSYAPGSCDGHGVCLYAPNAASNCANGCSNGACNSAGPTYSGDVMATGSATVAVALDVEPNTASSSGIAPADTPIAIARDITPASSLHQLSVVWSTDAFATSTTNVMSTASNGTGTTDGYQLTIPAQPSGTTVRFHFDGVAWNDVTHIVDPAGGLNYTYVTQ